MRITTAILLTAILGLAACGNDADKETPLPPTVAYLEVKQQPAAISTVLPGRTTPVLLSEVRPQVGGIIQKRLFVEGSDVKAGDVLYLIDPAPYQAAYANAEANLSRAQANLRAVELEAQRYGQLVKINAVSKQEYDNAVAARGQNLADVAAAKAALETARINLEYTKVTAPVSGRIGRSSVTPGALVTQNQPTALATVQQLDEMYVDLTQSSVDLLLLRKALEEGLVQNGNPDEVKVSLILEDGSTYRHPGKLQFSDVTVDESTGMVTLRAVFPNPEHLLLPNMYVRAYIEEGIQKDSILVPQKAVTRTARGTPQVKVLNKNATHADYTVSLREITTTRSVGNQWLVSKGLKTGELVVVEGLQRAIPGAEVNGRPATETELGVSAPLTPEKDGSNGQ